MFIRRSAFPGHHLLHKARSSDINHKEEEKNENLPIPFMNSSSILKAIRICESEWEKRRRREEKAVNRLRHIICRPNIHRVYKSSSVTAGKKRRREKKRIGARCYECPTTSVDRMQACAGIYVWVLCWWAVRDCNATVHYKCSSNQSIVRLHVLKYDSSKLGLAVSSGLTSVEWTFSIKIAVNLIILLYFQEWPKMLNQISRLSQSFRTPHYFFLSRLLGLSSLFLALHLLHGDKCSFLFLCCPRRYPIPS